MAEPSLPDLWKEAESRFQRRTGKPLKLSPAKTLEDVRKDIESQQTEDAGTKEDAKKRAKDFSMNALQCLKLLGGVAAQGASMVFGPADLCFNAISILIDIPSDIHEFHEAVDGMFEQVSIFLSQFKIYSRIEAFSTIDPELMRLIHKLMISFVDICALSISLRKSGKWKSFKGGFKKVIFNNDSGVKAELDSFQALIATHSSIQETITLEEVLHNRTDLARVLLIASDTKESITDIAKRLDHVAEGIDVLTTAEGARKSEQITKENQKKITDKLLGSTDVAQRSTTTCNDCWVASMKNSGEWLHDLPEYESWVDRKPEANPLLLVTGDPNTGKSFLSSVIVHKLQSSRGRATQPSSRTPLVAYHFFPKKTEKSTQNPRPAETALKCLAVQIADRDPAYAKKLLALCESSAWADGTRFKDLSCKELWQSLNFVVPKRDLTYFIIFDGLDQLPKESSDQLLDILSDLKNSLPDSDRHQLRVIATGLSNTFSKEQFGDVPRIHVPECNIQEIGNYIDHQLQEKDLLQGKDPETVKLRDSIRDKLPKLVDGDFFKVRTVIVKINDLVASDGSAAEVESILKEAGQSREEIAQDVVTAANQTLSAREIDEVNEILVWAIFGEEYFEVDEMQAALYLRFGTIPLQPLEKKLKGKYNKLFDFGDGLIRVGDEIEKVVTTTANTRIKVEEIPQITATITITKANLSVAQNFLWNLCEQGVIKKFEFNESAAATTSKGTIRVNEFDAHFWIIKQSLKLLSGQPEPRTKPLAEYVLEYFPTHLQTLREHKNFEHLEENEKREIGQGVYSYIGDGDILEKFWGANGPPETNWIDEDEDIGFMWKWLEDEEATRFLGKKDKEWLRSIKQDPNPDRSLLRPMIKMVAKHWLLDRAWDVRAPFEWIRSFLEMDIEKKADSEAVEEPSNESDIPVQEEKVETEIPEDENSSHISGVGDPEAVAAAAKWVQKIHKVSNLDSLWYERLGETYRILSEYDPAIEALTQATKFENPNWNCFRCLALALASRDESGDVALAITEMEKVLDTLRKMQEVQENKDDANSKLVVNLKQMAAWQIELQNSEKAQACYQEILAADPDNIEANYQVLRNWLRTGQEERFRASLEILSKRKPKESELSTLGGILTFLGAVEDRNVIYGMMFLATQKTALFDVLLENLEDALALARKESRLFDLAVLLLHTGIALYHFDQREKKNPESALSLWAECGSLSTANSFWEVQYACRRAYRLTSLHYFHRAKASQDPSPHVEKLKQILSRQQSIDRHAKSYLGCYYAYSGNVDEAKKLFLDDFMTALALLSDEYEWNDYQGYLNLAEILMHSGDYLNSLSAWSLIIPADVDLAAIVLDSFTDEPQRSIAQNLKGLIPNEVQTISRQRRIFDRLIQEVDRQISELEAEKKPEEELENGPESSRKESLVELRSTLSDRMPEQSDNTQRDGSLHYSCDGLCGKHWKYSDDFYCCKFCPDVQFCKDCREKLTSGKLQIFICSPEHEWMHVPEWDDEEYARVGRGKVKVGGTWDGEARVGGEVVTIEAWLNLLRDEWGVPRVAATDRPTAAAIPEL